MFYRASRPWPQRDIPVLLTGTLSPEVYPLRCRLAELIRARKIPGRIHPHPGNYLASLEACDAQERHYAELLGRTKVFLTCSSRYRYALAKYVEAAMAGCCVMSDLPAHNQAEHMSFMREIHTCMSDAELVAAVKRAVEDQEGSRIKAERGQQLMLDRYRMEDYVTRLIGAIKEQSHV
jgi:hypothetical protein